MAAIDLSANARTLHESFCRFSLTACCQVPPASVSRMMSSPDVILGARKFENDFLCNKASGLHPSEVSPITETLGLDHVSYNWGSSTNDNYQSENDYDLGIFASIRQQLDYEYHSYYKAPRRRLQDDIIESFLSDHPIDDTNSSDQWIIFTAGCMGAGKTHTLRELSKDDIFSFDLNSFVSVDPDEIRSQLPEYRVYIEKDPLHAGEFTRKEAGMLVEILTEEALERGNNVLVDGSLKDAVWYKAYFEMLRHKYPRIKIGIIHVTAPVEDILQRVEQRAQTTGRRIPMDVLVESMVQVPKSVNELCRDADLFLEVDNSSGNDIRFTRVKGMESLNPGNHKIKVQ
ncbi:unnamed protein product [Cylindrotheca closterium]|uniref:Zeta toxin domain-containing protein n=1 Tax=Cylindrotheca closterium TaxID=2856 RepID=A0AAD2FFL3_9STRA|nr:unnamed protein product [Cylindrotheca closterium]